MASKPRTILVAVGDHSDPDDPLQVRVGDVVKWYNLIYVAAGEGMEFRRASVSNAKLQVGERVSETGFVQIVGPPGPRRFQPSDSPSHNAVRHSLLIRAVEAGPSEATIVFQVGFPVPHEDSYQLFVNIAPP